MFVEFLVIGSDQAAARRGALASRHVEDIHVFHQLGDDLLDSGILELGLALLDEISVLGNETAVKDQRDAVLAGDGLDLAQVGHGERLSADQVGGGLHAHVRDVFHAVLGNDRFQFIRVHIALEGIATGCFQRAVLEDLQHLAARQVHMRLGRGEVVIHGHHVAGFNKSFGQQVFRRASLVSRQQILKSQNFLDRIGQLIETLAAGVSLVRNHHGAQLVVAHGVGAAVGQHVQEDIARAQEESVITGLADGLQALGGAGQIGLLHNFNLVHFDRYYFAC